MEEKRTNTYRMRLKPFLGLALLFTLATSACQRVTDPASPPMSRATDPPAMRMIIAPVEIGLMIDKTGSTKWTRTQQLEPEDLKPLIDLLRRTGGEIGVGLISDDSNRSLLRLRVEVPPIEPKVDIQDPQVGDLDAYEAAQKQRDNNAKRAELEKNQVSYLDAKTAWEKQTGQDIQQFSLELKKLLSVKPKFGASDVWGGIARCELFLAEDNSVWPQGATPHRFLALVSDGQHNVASNSQVSLNSGARLLLINGSRSVGELGHLNPLMFESAQAAFLYITTIEGGKK